MSVWEFEFWEGMPSSYTFGDMRVGRWVNPRRRYTYTYNYPRPIRIPRFPFNPQKQRTEQVAHWSTHEEGKGVLPLRVGDVLMEVDGLAVDDTGLVAMPPHRLQVAGGGAGDGWKKNGDYKF